MNAFGCSIGALLLTLGACSKTSSPDSAPAAASSVLAVAVSAKGQASAQPNAPAASAAAGPATGPSSWSGSYTAKVGAVEPPKNAKEKTWTADPGSAAIGPGSMDVAIGERGEARGETKGSLGEMTISGVYDGKELRANLNPKEPKVDGAMTGFMVLAAEGSAMKGTLRVSNRDARIVREATVELAKK